MRVLVVGEDAAVEDLTRAGHDVVGCATTSREAMTLAQTQKPTIALIDLDLEEKAEGLELAEKFTADLDIDVIVCSEHADLSRPAPTGAVALLRKPYRAQDIVDSIAVVEAMRRGRGPLPPFPSAFELLINPQ